MPVIPWRRSYVKILLIDNDANYARVVERMLNQPGADEFKIKSVPDLKAGLECLSKENIDLILFEFSFQDSEGLDALQKVMTQAPDAAVIILTEVDSQTLAFNAVQRGAQDYLVKKEVDEKILLRAVYYGLNQKEAKKTLQASQDRFQKLVEATLEAIVIHEQGKISTVNTALTPLFGYEPVEIAGTFIENLATPECRELLTRNIQSGYEGIYECTFLRKDKTTFQGEVRGKSISYGDRTANVTAIRDITERKQLEDLKNEFVSTVSHELRTPLTVIREAVSIVSDGGHGPVTEKQKHFLALTLSNIDRLTRIINDLLDISKIEARKMQMNRELVDMVSLVKEVTATFQVRMQSRGLEMKEDVPKEKIEVYLDRDKIIQVFTNLIGNALKFTQQGSIGVSVANKEQYLECTVWDTGKGIAARDLPKVFGKFQQFGRATGGAGEKGTGLGLAISKGIVELHEGTIRVESQLGKGTQFIFTLPKCSSKEVFKEYVARAIKEANKQKLPLSVVVFDLKNFDELKRELSPPQMASLLSNLDAVVRNHIRPQTDAMTRNAGTTLVVLVGTGRDVASTFAKGVLRNFNIYLFEEGLGKKVEPTYKIASFPDDAKNEEDLLSQTSYLAPLKN